MKAKKLLIVLVLLAACLGIAAKTKDNLYEQMRKQAISNIKNMPSQIKADYNRLLKKYPDRLMAFLLAYEENARLAAADPKVVENHYRSVRILMSEQGILQPDEFFLSYVAKMTVSDEAISDYRTQFEANKITEPGNMFDGLGLKALRNKENDQMELYWQMCLISTELLQYKPTSGRDQSPLDVAAKSLYGRCEESQILFVALCRTVGIPARAASTPWWAHQDDNHAWAEVFIDGKWHYTGDADSGYWLNQTWFSHLTDKMVIITADGTLPAPDDEVLSQDRYGATINSVRTYAGDNTRTIKVKVVDADGRPAYGAILGINVYNYYSLRPQAFTKTDENGEKTISVGQGAFFFIASKDSLAAIRFIPSGGDKVQEYTLVLNKATLDEQSVQMVYPNLKVEFRDSPSQWKESVRWHKELWNQRGDEITKIANPEFFELVGSLPQEEFDELMHSLSKNKVDYLAKELIGIRRYLFGQNDIYLPDSLFFQVLRKARLNMNELLGFDIIKDEPGFKINTQNPEIYSQWLSVLLKNDEKDLWQANGWLFYRMFYHFNKLYPQVSQLAEEELLNLFDPTVFYENLPWMSYYYSGKDLAQGLYPDRMLVRTKQSPKPDDVISYFSKKHRVKPDKALFGLLPLDVALFQKNMMPYQYKILAVSYLRANGIPANYTRIPDVISVYADNQWNYYDLKKNAYYETEIISDTDIYTIVFNFYDELEQPVALKPEQVQVCFLRDGMLFPTSRKTNYVGNGVFTSMLPKSGMFYAQIGYRNGDSLTVYHLQPLKVDGRNIDSLAMQLTHYHHNWLPAEDIYQPIVKELEVLGIDYAVLGNFNKENTIRIANKFKAEALKFVVIGYQQGRTRDFDYSVPEDALELVREVPSLQNRTITLVRDKQKSSWLMYEGLWEKLPK